MPPLSASPSMIQRSATRRPACITRNVASLLPLLLLLAASGCSAGSGAGPGGDAGAGDSAGGGTQTFTGGVTGSDAEIGLVFGGGKALVFTCGGATTFSTLTRWYRGAATLPGPFTLQDSGWTVTGSLQSDGMTVTGTLAGPTGGTTMNWQATAVGTATATGFYDD